MSLSFHHFKLLTYNIHHSRGTTTDSLAGVIGWTGVGPSITKDQKRFASRVTTITVIVTTRDKAAATCWGPAISYLINCTHSSASQGDGWCCSVVWRLVAFLRWSVADVNHNLEGWRKTHNKQLLQCSYMYNKQELTEFQYNTELLPTFKAIHT